MQFSSLVPALAAGLWGLSTNKNLHATLKWQKLYHPFVQMSFHSLLTTWAQLSSLFGHCACHGTMTVSIWNRETSHNFEKFRTSLLKHLLNSKCELILCRSVYWACALHMRRACFIYFWLEIPYLTLESWEMKYLLNVTHQHGRVVKNLECCKSLSYTVTYNFVTLPPGASLIYLGLISVVF